MAEASIVYGDEENQLRLQELSELSERLESILSLQLEDDSKELNVVVVGRFQVGKSTLINSFFFREGNGYRQKAKEGAMKPLYKRS